MLVLANATIDSMLFGTANSMLFILLVPNRMLSIVAFAAQALFLIYPMVF